MLHDVIALKHFTMFYCVLCDHATVTVTNVWQYVHDVTLTLTLSSEKKRKINQHKKETLNKKTWV